jgi:hypothetical protein
VKTCNLEDFAVNYSSRISKLPVKLQLIFFEDLTTAAENRLFVLEKVGLKKVE